MHHEEQTKSLSELFKLDVIITTAAVHPTPVEVHTSSHSCRSAHWVGGGGLQAYFSGSDVTGFGRSEGDINQS